MKNKYIGRSKLSEAKFRELLRCFCLDLDAGRIAQLIRVNRNTVNRYLRLIRERLRRMCESESLFDTYSDLYVLLAAYRFPADGVGRKGCRRSPPAFGAALGHGHVTTELLPDFCLPHLLPAIRGKSDPGNLGRILRFRGHRAVMHFSGRMPLYLDPAWQRIPFLEERRVLEHFWFFAKRRLRKFQGIPRTTFPDHLKECEFRFNNRQEDMYAHLLKVFRDDPMGEHVCRRHPDVQVAVERAVFHEAAMGGIGAYP